jgi:hypothetical protein
MKSLIIQLLFAVLLLPQMLWAQTFVVTSSSSCGSGSFNEAVQYANSTPGKDRIEFDPGLREIRVLYCPGQPPPDEIDFFLAKATESVDIVGIDDLDPSTSAKEHLKFKGYNQWVSSSGHTNPDRCPRPGLDIVIALAPGLLIVGNYGVDNSGIDVTLTNIDVDGLNTLAWVNKAASLNISNGSFTNMESGFRDCDIPTIEVKEQASLSLYETHFQDNKVMDSFDSPDGWNGLIAASDSVVEIQDSTFSYNQTGGLILQVGGNLTIVNTKVDTSQGVGALDTVVHIVNTAFWSNRIDNRSTNEGVHVEGASGSITLDAATIYTMAWQQATPPYDIFGFTTHSVQFSATLGASATLIDTAIGATWPKGSTLDFSYTTGASGVSVTRSWVRDGSLPGADATLPGLSDNAYRQFEMITPVAGGALIDKSAATLLNPLTGAVITTDVLGNPRVSGSLRDIGAIELPQVYVADKSYSTVTDTPINELAANGLLAGSTTPAGTTLYIRSNTTPAHGSVTVDPYGSFVYTPSTGYYGTDAFSFTATNTASQSQDGDVTITVTPPTGTPPTAANDAYYDTIPTTCITIAAPGVLTNDTDPVNALGTPPKQPNDGLTARKVTDPAKASLTFNADGSFSLCPDDPSLVWEYSFTYDVITTDSRVSSPATVTVQHRLNASKPIATQDSYTQTGGFTWTIPTLGVLTNDVDPNNQFQVPSALPNQDMVSVLVTGVSHGTLQLNTDGSFEYTPKNGYSGIDSFTYKAVASKGLGQESNPTTVTLTVQAGATQLPGKPGLSIITAGTNSATLGWTTPSSGTSPITGYLVHYRQTGIAIWTSWPNTSAATSTTITGLTSGKTYEFQVAAFSAVGSGPFSATVSTTQAPTVTSQGVSSITTTTASSGGNVTSSGGAQVTARGVCWSTSANPTIFNSKTTDSTGTGIFTSSITGLSPGTIYHLRAYATNADGMTGYGGSGNSFKTSSASIFLYVNKDGHCGDKTPCYSYLQDAIDAAPTGANILISETYDESTVMDESKALFLHGGWNSTFTIRYSDTTVINSIAITGTDGTVEIDDMVLQEVD